MRVTDWRRLRLRDRARSAPPDPHEQASPVEIVESALRRVEAHAAGAQSVRHRHRRSRAEGRTPCRDGGDGGRRSRPADRASASIKDLTAVKGVRFTSGSRTLADFIAPLDSPPSERVKAHGAAIIGKTTTTEFGCKASSDSPLTGITRNPWNLGQDHRRLLRRSRRQRRRRHHAVRARHRRRRIDPHSLLVLRPVRNQGAVRSRSGVSGCATPTLAHVGPMARTVRDAALLLTAISGFDERDPASVAAEVPDYLGACEQIAKGLRIAWSPTLGYARPIPRCRDRRQGGARVRGDRLHGRAGREGVRRSDRPVDGRILAGVGTRLKRPLTEQRDLIDPAVAEVLTRRSIRPRGILSPGVRALRVPRKGPAVLRALRPPADADTPVTAFESATTCRPSSRARNRRLGRLYLSVQSVRPAGRIDSLRVHPRRPAGRPAHRSRALRETDICAQPRRSRRPDHGRSEDRRSPGQLPPPAAGRGGTDPGTTASRHTERKLDEQVEVAMSGTHSQCGSRRRRGGVADAFAGSAQEPIKIGFAGALTVRRRSSGSRSSAAPRSPSTRSTRKAGSRAASSS